MAVTVRVSVAVARSPPATGPLPAARPLTVTGSSATARTVSVAVAGTMPVGRLGRRNRGLLHRGHRPIIARTDRAHCSARPM